MSKTIPIPTIPEAIKSEWLTRALRSTEAIGDTCVIALAIEPMNGAGAIGQMARLTPVYDDRAENVPASLIAKLSHADPDLKLGFFDLYARESQVYQSLLDQIKLTMPHCYYCDLRQETGDSILLLEDLGHLRQAIFA